MKKTSILCMILLGVLACWLAPSRSWAAVLATGQCGDNLTYTIYDDMSMVITGTGPMTNYDWSLPSMNDTYKYSIKSLTIEEGVTTIGDYAFNNWYSIASVTIPEGITYIGLSAFSNTNLSSIDLPNTVTYLGNFAFNCLNLTSLTIPNSVTEIGNYCFNSCSGLTSLYIPYSVTSIGGSAFSGCTGLTSIIIDADNPNYDSRNNCNAIIETSSNTLIKGCQNTLIPDNVTNISANAFSDCIGLTSLVIPSSVTQIGSGAFNSCTSLTSLTMKSKTPPSVFENTFESDFFTNCTIIVPEGCISAYRNASVWSDFTNIVEPNVLATGSCGNNLTYKIYSDMSMVISGTGPMLDYSNEQSRPYNEYANSIESVTIEDGATTIGTRAFRSFNKLASVSIPNTVIEIGKFAFESCTSLNPLTIPYGVTIIYGWAFNNCRALTSVTIPNSVTTIAVDVFGYCTSLTSVTIPSSVTIISGSTFSGCSALASITVDPDNNVLDSRNNCNAIIETSTNKLLSGCNNTVIPNSVTSIGEDAFVNRSNLTSVTIPNSVTEIYSNAFRGCTGLTSITCESETPISLFDDEFDGVDRSSCTLYVPAGSKSAYQNAQYWGEFENIVEFMPPLATGQCGDNLTYKIYSDMSMVISGTGPMWDYSNEQSRPYNEYANSIESVTIEDGATTIVTRAFRSFANLTSVSIPNSVTEICSAAFDGCTSLTSVTIPYGVNEIGSYAFRRCTDLASVTILDGVKTISVNAFERCTSLTSVNIPSSVTDVGESAFEGCTALASITVDAGNNILDSRDNCNAIIKTSTNKLLVGCKTTVIPNSVTFIGNDAFCGCTSLTSMNIPNGVTVIGWDAFMNCSGLTSVTIPSSVTDICNLAFVGCTSLTTITCERETPVSLNSDVFYGVNKSSCTLYVPVGSKSAYENAQYWNEFTNIVEYGEEPDTDISAYENIVYIEGTETIAGQRIDLLLMMNNTVNDVTGFQFNIVLPEGITAAKNEEGDYLIELSGTRTTLARHTISSALQPDGSIKVLCSSQQSKTFSGNEGEVAKLTVDIDPEIEAGSYPLILTDIVISDKSSQTYKVDYVKTTLTIIPYKLGDANNDSEVDIGDFTAIANFILNLPSASFVEQAADVNVDGAIDVGDLTGVANIILYGSVSPEVSNAKARDGGGSCQAAIYASDITATTDREFSVAINIDGDYPFSGYQFDISLPEGLKVKEVNGQPKSSEMFMSNMVEDNLLRVLCTSTSGSTRERTVINLTLESEGAGTYSVVIGNALISSNATTYTLDNSTFLVGSGVESTGLSNLGDERGGQDVVYDLAGNRVNHDGDLSGLRRGLYIINGKKVSK